MQTLERTNQHDKTKKAKLGKFVYCKTCTKKFRRSRVANVYCSMPCYYQSRQKTAVNKDWLQILESLRYKAIIYDLTCKMCM